ncbi:helix-turn-helix domain-containing protein [Streptomyces sp. ST1015]|uniref:helix-turn-helix domain-containing protein n=1 Tax=Streptomyces sp. ST1015 TaxID=1848900 RepID=UPI001CA69E6F|nr:helix-turn-helix transcriptional regulator [Streptomyces sp. ST1015]QZZ25816.1 AAA family ATPase [Streptomyces sp. ST1015]
MRERRGAVVGRGGDIGTLTDALRATGGAARVLLVTAGTGTGRTTVLEEARRTAARAGTAVVRVGPKNTKDADDAIAVTADRGLVLTDPDDRLAGLPGPLRSRLRAAGRVGGAEGLSALSGALASAARQMPLALVVDDVDLLPPPAAEALGLLLRVFRPYGVPVVMTARRAQPSVAADHVLELPPLRPADVAVLVGLHVTRRFGRPADPALADAVSRALGRLAGNPRAVLSVLGTLDEGDLLELDGLMCLARPARDLRLAAEDAFPLEFGLPHEPPYSGTVEAAIVTARVLDHAEVHVDDAFRMTPSSGARALERRLDRLITDGILAADPRGRLSFAVPALAAALRNLPLDRDVQANSARYVTSLAERIGAGVTGRSHPRLADRVAASGARVPDSIAVPLLLAAAREDARTDWPRSARAYAAALTRLAPDDPLTPDVLREATALSLRHGDHEGLLALGDPLHAVLRTSPTPGLDYIAAARVWAALHQHRALDAEFLTANGPTTLGSSPTPDLTTLSGPPHAELDSPPTATPDNIAAAQAGAELGRLRAPEAEFLATTGPTTLDGPPHAGLDSPPTPDPDSIAAAQAGAPLHQHRTPDAEFPATTVPTTLDGPPHAELDSPPVPDPDSAPAAQAWPEPSRHRVPEADRAAAGFPAAGELAALGGLFGIGPLMSRGAQGAGRLPEAGPERRLTAADQIPGAGTGRPLKTADPTPGGPVTATDPTPEPGPEHSLPAAHHAPRTAPEHPRAATDPAPESDPGRPFPAAHPTPHTSHSRTPHPPAPARHPTPPLTPSLPAELRLVAAAMGGRVELGRARRELAGDAVDEGSLERLRQAAAHADLSGAFAAVLGDRYVTSADSVAATYRGMVRDHLAGDWDAALAAARRIEVRREGASYPARALAAEIHCARGDLVHARTWLGLVPDTLTHPLAGRARLAVRYWSGGAEEALEGAWYDARRARKDGQLAGVERLLLGILSLAALDGRPYLVQQVVEELETLHEEVDAPLTHEALLLARGLAHRDTDSALAAYRMVERRGDADLRVLCCMSLTHIADDPRPWLAEAVREARRLGLGGPFRTAAHRAARLRDIPLPRLRRADEKLSDADGRLLRMVSDGATNRQIAADLACSPKTVEQRLARLFQRTGSRSRTELAAFWLTENLAAGTDGS